MRLAQVFAALMVLIGSSAMALAAQNLPAAPAAMPTPIPAPNSFENQPIHRDGDAPVAVGGTSAPAPANGFEPTRVVLALVIVIALVLLLRAGARRILPGAAGVKANHSIKIVARTPIAPRQNILLVQVGKRLIVVGDSGSQLNPLCEITDAQEVESLVAQVRQEAAAGVKKFEGFFNRSREPFEKEAPFEAPFDQSHDEPDPAVQDTQRELTGLSEKVRELARQITQR